MKPTQAVCNYALLRFHPYPERGEVVNVGVVVTCNQPCFFEGQFEEVIPDRVQAMFPDQGKETYRAGIEAVRQEVLRIKNQMRDPQSVLRAFGELIRPRETTFRFSDVRSAMTENPHEFCDELFRRYVRMGFAPPELAVE